MKKIFLTNQTKELDAQIISDENITSFELMKRAVKNLFSVMCNYLHPDDDIFIVAGPGNNGGDALVLAKVLYMISFKPTVCLINPANKLSADCETAKGELKDLGIPLIEISDIQDFTIPDDITVIIDGIFGAGLNRKLSGIYKDIVERINNFSNNKKRVFAIDIPSGLMGENNEGSFAAVKATRTFSFQSPKLAFLLADAADFAGEISIVDLEVQNSTLSKIQTDKFLIEENDICLLKRKKFSHKGTYGHALLFAGKYGMAGAAILAAHSCMRMGVGLLTIHIPSLIYDIIQQSIPEAITQIDKNSTSLSDFSDISSFSALGIGPGIGTNNITQSVVFNILRQCGIERKRVVIDADGLNIISLNGWLDIIPKDAIITPHPKEFDRLFGFSKSFYERLQKQVEASKKYSIVIILKGAHTSISTPDGKVYFNTSGNPGMATAGSGDVLTGILLSLLAQNYPTSEAAIIGTFIHGLAGDIAAKKLSEYSLIASDIIKNIPEAIHKITNKDS